MQNIHNSFRPNKSFCLSDCVAFIYNVTFYFLSASKSLILQQFPITKTIMLRTFRNPVLSYQTHTSAIKIFTLTKINMSSSSVSGI